MTCFSVSLESSSWHYAAVLRTLSVTYPLCGSSLIDTMDNLSEKSPNKLTFSSREEMPVLYYQPYTIFQRPHILPMAFTGYHDPGSNQQPPDERAGTCYRHL